jgi:Tol biopolymer transport system component
MNSNFSDRASMHRHLLAVAIVLLVLVSSCRPTAQVAHGSGSGRGTPKVLADTAGLSTDPAISTDGRWLAFASDRDGSGFLNLWVQPLSGGDPRRVTEEATDHVQPAFSPDGAILVYRREGRSAGVYVTSVSGGTPRLLAAGGRRPRFSPNGKQIVYSIGTRLFSVDSSGGEPRSLHASFHSAGDAAWSPDGEHLIFTGCKDSSVESCDWWVTPAGGGEAVATGAGKLMRQHRFVEQPPANIWLSGNVIVFAGRIGETTRLWKLRLVSKPWRIAEPPQRITNSDQEEHSPAISPTGQIVFASRRTNVDVYSLPLDAERALPNGTLKRLTRDPAIDQRPSLSRDGTKLAWETSRGGNFEVWVKDLTSGNEKGLTSGPLREHMPALSRDGSRVIYDSHDGERVTVFEAAFEGGEPVKVWEENVGQGSFQWTAKGDAVLYFHRAPPGTVGLMNLSSKRRTVLLRHPKFNLALADARLSTDERWIVFPVPYAPHRSRLALARASSGKPIEDERDWSYLTPDTFNASQPEWSPDGKWLYFLSDEKKTLEVWALPLSAEKKPNGERKPILTFAGARLTITEMRPRDIGLSVAVDKLALGVAEYTGMLWSVQR